MSDEVPRKPETDPDWNMEPGIVPTPGSRYLQEVAKFEQHHSKFTAGTKGPGNPYVYRPYPKMLFRAEHIKGVAHCMAPPLERIEYRDQRQFEHMEEQARKFTERCQRIVKDEAEHHRAAEDGWRDSPQEAVECLKAKDLGRSTATAERLHEDRNMSPEAQAEAQAQTEAAGGAHQPEIKRKPVRRRGRPKGSKNKPRE